MVTLIELVGFMLVFAAVALTTTAASAVSVPLGQAVGGAWCLLFGVLFVVAANGRGDR